MGKKLKLGITAFGIIFVFLLSMFAIGSWPSVARANPNEYSITLNADDKAGISSSGYKSGSKTVHNVIFNYVDSINSTGYHTQMKASSGTIANDQSTQITSIVSVYAVYSSSSDLVLTTGSSANPADNLVTLANGIVTYVTGNPYYFMVGTGSAYVSLSSLTITYSCIPSSSSTSISNPTSSSSATSSSTSSSSSSIISSSSSSSSIILNGRRNPVTSSGTTGYAYNANGTIYKTLTKGTYYTELEDVVAYLVTFKALPVNYYTVPDRDSDGSGYSKSKATCYGLYGSSCRISPGAYDSNYTYLPTSLDEMYVEADIGGSGYATSSS